MHKWLENILEAPFTTVCLFIYLSSSLYPGMFLSFLKIFSGFLLIRQWLKNTLQAPFSTVCLFIYLSSSLYLWLLKQFFKNSLCFSVNAPMTEEHITRLLGYCLFIYLSVFYPISGTVKNNSLKVSLFFC